MNKIFTKLVLLMAVIMMPLTMQAQTYPCLDGIEDMEFETPDDLIAYIEANCDSTVVEEIFGGDYEFPIGDGIIFEFGGEFDLPCLDGIEDEDFATEDEFLAYLYANCDSLTIDSLFGSWGSGDDYEWDEEDEMEWLAEYYGECLGDEVFTDLEAMYTYIEENCEDYDWDDYEWSEEDEMAWLADVYADCVGDQAFSDLEAMYTYIEENCEDFGDWGTGDYDDDWDCGDFDWSEQDEMDFLAEEFGECIGDETFADLEEMYAFIFENCEDVNDGGGVIVDIEGDVDFDPACLSGLEQGFATFQEMILFLDANCADLFAFDLPDCFLNAPTFDNDAAFFQYLEDNCSEVFEDDQGSQTFSDDQMGSLIAQYNLAGANAAANEQTTVGIEAVDGLNMSMFPNPASDFVQMTITEDVIEDFQVYDIKGSMLINSTNLNSPTVTIDLVELNVGTYFVKVSTENGKTFSNTIIVR